MKQILAIITFLVISPALAVVYIVVRMALEIWHRNRRADRYRFSTPAQRHRFDQLHQERVFRVQNVGQTVR